ncbi:DUF1800 domain-containing protein (plasmid) [Paracoccus saliphilus]|nr:DUF1800 domain-containing protein [Paracoccus saliphilus]WCR05676.1 DUF1800 domain-containing protein [Paracoccus saliphilus]
MGSLMISYPELATIRLGYGLSSHMVQPFGPDEILAAIHQAGPDGDTVNMEQLRKLQLRTAKLRQRIKLGEKRAREAYTTERQYIVQLVRKEMQRRFARAIDDPIGFGERLVQFWADHFTVGGGPPHQRLMTACYVNEAIRPHITGNFADLMFAAETHPSMLIYLNQNSSIGPNSRAAQKAQEKRHTGLNENLAREMIELHSLGVGADYTQKDVRQLAKLLTGLTYRAMRDELFNANRAEPGPEIVLGKHYGEHGAARLSDIRAVITDLARHPDTAQHLARKLAIHFVTDQPPQSLVDRLARVYADTDGDLNAMNTELVEAPELTAFFRHKIRQPFDFMVASLRSLGVTGNEIMALKPRQFHGWLTYPLAKMGQQWGNPPGPDGWPESGENWVTPQGIAARIDWAMRIPIKLRKNLPDPRQLLQVALGDTASEALQWAVPKAETARDGVAIVLASADFNRR